MRTNDRKNDKVNERWQISMWNKEENKRNRRTGKNKINSEMRGGVSRKKV